MKLIIVFTGLIAHIASGPNWWAVAVEAQHHKPQLVARRSALLSECKAPACVVSGPPTNQIVTIGLSGEQFTIEGLTSDVHPTKSPEFDASVPSLFAILQAPIDQDASEGNVTHPGVAAAIQLGHGTISPGNCPVVAAEWTGAGTPLPACLAESTIWIGDLKQDSATLKGATNSWTFKAGARLEFRNEHPGNHFANYANLSKTTIKREPRPSTTGICVLCKPVEAGDIGRVLTPPDLECTPTRYP